MKVLIIDDHPVIAVAVETLIKKSIPKAEVSMAEEGRTGFRLIKENDYDIIILDVNLPDTDVLSLVPNILLKKEDSRILIFTATPENILAKRLFSLNVRGFLSKGSSDEEIMKAIHMVLDGKRYLSAEFSQQMITSFMDGKDKVENPFELLSDREYQIMSEMLNGNNAKSISEKLHLHYSSVNTYRARVYNKLEVGNQMELYEKAKAFGIK